MAGEYALVSVPRKSNNAGRPSGKKSYIYLFRWGDIELYTRDEKGVKVTAFRFKTGKQAIGIYATSSTINIYHQSTGDEDAKGFTHHVDYENPGSELEILEFYENNINERLGAIVINCVDDVCKIAGTPCNPIEITQANGQDNNEADKQIITMASMIPGPALGLIAKTMIPPTDNADINSDLGLGTGSSGGGL